MTVTLSRRAWRLLTSPRLATVVIALVGGWAVLASFVPQGDATAAPVAEWAAAYPGFEALAGPLGLHRAFTAPVFLVFVALLAVLTAACAWQRTRVAAVRSRFLRTAVAEAGSPDARADFEIVCRPGLSSAEALVTTAETLERLGIRPTRAEKHVTAVSPLWSVWGSAVFHWALVTLMVVIALGSLARSSGQMGIAVGEAKPDVAESYGVLDEGSLHSFGAGRSIRVDAFDVNYETGGVKRGATPTVTVLNAAGEVVKTQLVYPNNTLKTGSLTIYPYDYGFSATVAMLDDSGAELQRTTQLIDFAGSAEGGTAPLGALVLKDEAGAAQYRMLISVPLDQSEGGGLVGRMPEDPRARVVLLNAAGEAVMDETLRPDETVALPSGGTLRLLGVDYYARLQLVDDPSIPLLYAAAIVAMIGLGAATLVRQLVISAWVAEDTGETKLRVRMRLWRALTTSRSEIESELRRALGPAEEGSAS
ncbi:MAG: cytochrome c biogenesis protein ResB [Coriobacteriia bacterium]|nr:cytochrome c biogenesis protein ResB [Coriobacteriia bacterium]